MDRYYAHYTFIYPDKLLKNYVVEIDSEGYISTYYPFEEEQSGTWFHSGLQIFLPEELTKKIEKRDLIKLDSRLEFLLNSEILTIRIKSGK